MSNLLQNQNLARINGELPLQPGWLSNILPAAGRTDSNQGSAENSPMGTPAHLPSSHSPQKPVNLLPEVPSQSSRKLSDREQRDCDVIGKHFYADKRKYLMICYLFQSA
jgi:hypothetical protein